MAIYFNNSTSYYGVSLKSFMVHNALWMKLNLMYSDQPSIKRSNTVSLTSIYDQSLAKKIANHGHTWIYWSHL